jgi:hypothetical protein
MPRAMGGLLFPFPARPPSPRGNEHNQVAVALAWAAHRAEAGRARREAHRNKRGSPLVGLTSPRTNAMPKPDDDRPRTGCPLGRQLCLPISPTCRKTRAPSCSRLLTLPRPPTRLRARFLLRPSLRRKSPAPRGTDAGRPTRCGTGADERPAWPNNGGGATFHWVGHSPWLRRPLGPCANQPPIASHIRFRAAVGGRECAATWR